jgi:hypothetical protein
MLGERFANRGARGALSESDARAGRGHGLDLAREGREFSAVGRLRSRIETHLTYPSELKTQGIQGEVEAKVRFGPNGEYLERETERSLRGPPFLRVLVARTLRAALEEPAARLPDGFALEARFKFLIAEGDDETIREAGNFALGRSLSFLRVHHESALEWELGPLSGLGPFTLGLDLSWAPRKIIEAASDRVEFDPLDSYRQDPAW